MGNSPEVLMNFNWFICNPIIASNFKTLKPPGTIG